MAGGGTRQDDLVVLKLPLGNARPPSPASHHGVTVIDRARLPGMPARGAIGLQHHGSKRDGEWVSSPSLMQFKNVFIRELD